MKSLEDRIEEAFDDYLFSSSYDKRIGAKIKLIELLWNYEFAEKLCYKKLIAEGVILSNILCLYMTVLHGRKYLKEFSRYLVTNNEDYLAAVFESLVVKYCRETDLFDEACGMIFESRRSITCNVQCAFAFREIASHNLNYLESLGPNAIKLRTDIKGLHFLGVGPENSW